MLLFGLHIPKCAGTTILMRAMSRLPFHAVYQCTNLERNFRENRMEFAHLYSYEKLKLVVGHLVHEEMLKLVRGPISLFTGLREPRSRLKSHLIFLQTLRARQGLPPLDAEAQIARRSNPMCRFINIHFPTLAGDGTEAERALRVLDHFSCVYFVDRLDETAAPVFELLGIAPEKINWNIRDVPEEEVDIDVSGALLDQDTILYERARERFSGRKPLSREAENRLAAFRAEKPHRRKLQQSFYSISHDQYRDANMLDQVIAQRKRMILEIEAELHRYERLDRRDQHNSEKRKRIADATSE